MSVRGPNGMREARNPKKETPRKEATRRGGCEDEGKGGGRGGSANRLGNDKSNKKMIKLDEYGHSKDDRAAFRDVLPSSRNHGREPDPKPQREHVI